MIRVFISPCAEKSERSSAAELVKALSGEFSFEKSLYRSEANRLYIDMPGCDLSVSHTKGACAVALALPRGFCYDGAESIISLDVPFTSVGVDIETVSDKNEAQCKKIAERFFNKSEAAYLDASHNYVTDFVKMWTVKEACFKTASEEYGSIFKVNALELQNGYKVFSEEVNIGFARFICSLCIYNKLF